MDFLIEARRSLSRAVASLCIISLERSGIGFERGVSEDFETKQSCFSVLQVLWLSRDEACCFETGEAAGLQERSVLASNTSSISISKLAAKVPRPMCN